jgi:hypothetical protein
MQTTLAQLTSMRLHGMARVWQNLQETRQLHETITGGRVSSLCSKAKSSSVSIAAQNDCSKNARFRYQASLEEAALQLLQGPGKRLW